MTARRILSGMRPTGALHLGHWRGVLDNWLRLQDEAECFFFVADWHALTTNYAAPEDLARASRDMVTAWLAAGIDGGRASLFIQSHIPEHAELHVLLSMVCPLSKLTQLPTYKEMRDNLRQDIDTYGFLGYPLLQSADILAYRADGVPVGEDQRPHVEFTREIARRVNHLYGGGEAFEKRARELLDGMPADAAKRIRGGRRRFRQSGDESALGDALRLIDENAAGDARATLRGYCLYDGDEILPAPEALLTKAAKLPGTDGRKMSKSYDNTIALFEEEEETAEKIARMKTDPARQRRADKGNPDNCPVWELHAQFSPADARAWAADGCRSAAIGCVECKKTLAAHVNESLRPLRERRREVERSGAADAAIAAGTKRARAVAAETLDSLRRAMRLRA